MKHLILSLSILSSFNVMSVANADFLRIEVKPFATHYETGFPYNWHNEGHFYPRYSNHFDHFHAWELSHLAGYSPWHDHAFYEADANLNQNLTYDDVYYPTDTIRQLLRTINSMPLEQQAHFQTGSIFFAERLTQDLANKAHEHVVLLRGDIVVNHYETTRFGQEIELAGSVNFRGHPYDFKGRIRLNLNRDAEAFVTDEIRNRVEPLEIDRFDELSPITPSAVSEVEVMPSGYQPPATAGSKPWYPKAAVPDTTILNRVNTPAASPSAHLAAIPASPVTTAQSVKAATAPTTTSVATPDATAPEVAPESSAKVSIDPQI